MFAIWKKNGWLSVGGEMSSATSPITGPGPPGAASWAKYGSIASVGVSTGSKRWAAAWADAAARSAVVNGCGLTSIVARLTPNSLTGDL